MSSFEDLEWGNSKVFSYYESSDSSNFKISSELESSLQRQKKKLKKKNGEPQQNKKRKFPEDGSEERKSLKKKKKGTSQAQNDAQSKVIDEKVPKTKSKDKKKKVPKIKGESGNQSNGDVSEKQKIGSKKKKNTNKRNKYKQLNTEQNKKKSNTPIAASINGFSQISLETMSNPLSTATKKSPDENHDKSVVKKNEIMSKSLKKKKRDLVVDTSQTEKIPGGSKSIKKKKKKVAKGSELVKDSLFVDMRNGETDIKSDSNNSISAKKIKKKKTETQENPGMKNLNHRLTKVDPSDGLLENVEISEKTGPSKKKKKKKGKGLENNVSTENNNINEGKSKTQKKGELSLDKKKIKTGLSKIDDGGTDSGTSKRAEKTNSREGKSKTKKKERLSNEKKKIKTGTSNIESDIDNGSKSKTKKKSPKTNKKNLKDPDAEDEAILKDLDEYMKGLYSDNLKSDDENEWNGSDIGDLEQAEEYVEDDIPKRKVKPSDKKATKKTKSVKSKRDEDTPAKSPDPGSTTTPKKGSKFDKDILSKLLQVSEPQDKEPEATTDTIKPVLSASEALKQKLMNQLNAAHFRIVNEKIYTASSKESATMFKSDPASFSSYHAGFKAQVALWPVNPLDTVIKWLSKKPKHWVIADFGCGEATLAAGLPQTTVHSFDLVAVNSRVTVCDMSHTPLAANSVDAVVFCLSLMGTNIKDFLLEANRVLKLGGIMKIAEVESRFEDTNKFVSQVKKFGFNSLFTDTSTKYFYMFDFKKYRNLEKKTVVPDVTLKACKYKKR